MSQITDSKLFELYIDTIDRCGIFLLDESDEVVEYNIFEEFDIGVISFLHLDTLKRLLERGYISENKLIKSSLLRDKVMMIQSAGNWSMESFRTSTQWKEIMLLCDEIKSTP